MKFLATLAVLAFASHYASAECNNMCSGHGTCGANDACTCYRNWRGNDCSERTCQYGVAFIDTPQGDLNHDGSVETVDNAVKTQWSPSGTFERYGNFENEEAKAYMECSNKGLCDRASGECVCFDGYEGSACQRTKCPNSCSGHGVCRNIVDKTESLAAANKYAYPLWDGLKNQACVCDPGYSGPDCRERLCPKGADPLDDGKAYEIQTVDVSGASVQGSFKLKYTDVFGEQWTTSSITHVNYAGTGVATPVKNALKAIPNSVIEDVTVVADTPGENSGCSYTITFTHNAGNLSMLEVEKSGMDDGVSSVVETTAGTTTASECSKRGLCDYETGICKCFRGYRLDDCSSQHALAYGSDSQA